MKNLLMSFAYLKDRHSIARKIFIYGSILCIISCIISTCAFQIVLDQTMSKQYDDVNKLAFLAAIDKTDTYLGDIAWIINTTTKNEDFNTLITSTDKKNIATIRAQRNYSNYLTSLIWYDDRIDAVVFYSMENNSFITASNNIDKYFNRYYERAFYENIETILESNPDNFYFLDNHTVDVNYNLLSVIAPVFSEQHKVLGFVVIAISKKIQDELSFTENVEIMDGIGSKATIIQNNKLPLKTKKVVKLNGNLNFNGWQLSQSYSYEKIDKMMMTTLFHNILVSLFFILIFEIVLLLSSKRFSVLLLNLKQQISGIEKKEIQSRRISFVNRHFGIRIKIITLYIAIVMIPSIIITFQTYSTITNINKTEIKSMVQISSEILYSQAEYVLQKYYNTTIQISYVNQELQNFFQSMNEPNSTKNKNQSIDKLIIQNNLSSKNRILNITIYDKNLQPVIVSLYGVGLPQNSEMENDLEYVKNNFGKPLVKTYSKLYFNSNCVRVGLQIRNVSTGELEGYIFIDYDNLYFLSLLEAFTKKSKDVFVVINDGFNTIPISTTDKSETVLLSSLSDMGLSGKTGERQVTINGIRYFILTKYFQANGWSLSVIYKGWMRDQNIVFVTKLVLSVLLIFCFMLSYIFTMIVSKSISKLITDVNRVKDGNMSTRFLDYKKDEIALIGQSFNSMLDELNDLVEEKIATELRVKNYELQARSYELSLLQQQINPHFLYNTLKTAQYMVYAKDTRAAQMINLLILFFRNSVSMGEKLTTLKNELDNVKTYLQIQQIRFSEKFDYKIEIPEEIMNLNVLKTTIQPIVENSIHHGFKDSQQNNTILFKAETIQNELWISITDDGCGIDDENLQILHRKLNENMGETQVGISNVHQRIKLKFGECYGVSIQSTVHKGTTVILKYPIMQEE